jgi:hypothetical protein
MTSTILVIVAIAMVLIKILEKVFGLTEGLFVTIFSKFSVEVDTKKLKKGVKDVKEIISEI